MAEAVQMCGISLSAESRGEKLIFPHNIYFTTVWNILVLNCTPLFTPSHLFGTFCDSLLYKFRLSFKTMYNIRVIISSTSTSCNIVYQWLNSSHFLILVLLPYWNVEYLTCNGVFLYSVTAAFSAVNDLCPSFPLCQHLTFYCLGVWTQLQQSLHRLCVMQLLVPSNSTAPCSSRWHNTKKAYSDNNQLMQQVYMRSVSHA